MKNRFLLLLLPVIFWGCHQSTGNDNGPRDPRHYQWKEYVLAQPKELTTPVEDMTMLSVWGVSVNDLYVAGDIDGSYNAVYHFDGKKWQWFDFWSNGSIGSIFGFSKDDIYAASAFAFPANKGIIFHYDGTHWTDLKLKIGTLFGGTGIAPDDMWFGGAYGNLYHFDGDSVKDYTMVDSLWFYSFAAFASDDVYAVAYGGKNGIQVNYFMHWDGVAWKMLEKDLDDRSVFGVYIKRIGENVYSVNNGLVSKYNRKDHKWAVIHASVDYNLYGIDGNREDNIFAVGTRNTILHYNGTDWFEYKNLISNDVEFGRVWTDGHAVFAVGRRDGQTHILRGN